jgi:adenosylcobinamide-phosphate synthase
MKFIAILVALGLEQWRIAGWRRASESLYVSFLRRLEVIFSSDRNTWLTTVAALSPVVAVAIIECLAGQLWWVYLVWSVLLLYFLMGFRHFSHAVSDINDALQEGDLPAARQALQSWQGGHTFTLTSTEVTQRAIEGGIVAAYRCVFGVFFWFCLLGGPGAAFYWMLNIISREWAAPLMGTETNPLSESRGTMGRAARWLLFLMDWIPIRVLAFTFAIVGDFEDAIYQWRALPDEYALFDNSTNENVLLATAMGALGVTWQPQMRSAASQVVSADDAIHDEGFDDHDVKLDEKPSANEDLGAPPVGEPLTPAALTPAIGMTWRAIIFWLLLVALLTLAGLWQVGF